MHDVFAEDEPQNWDLCFEFRVYCDREYVDVADPYYNDDYFKTLAEARERFEWYIANTYDGEQHVGLRLTERMAS